MTDIYPFYFSAAGELHTLVPDSAFQFGVLETMRAGHGKIPLWEFHRARLQRSASPPSEDLNAISASLEQVTSRTQNWPEGARVRLRYGVLQDTDTDKPVWDFRVEPLEKASPWTNGVLLGLCGTRLTRDATRSPFAPGTRSLGGGSEHAELYGCKLLVRDVYTGAAAEWPARATTGEPLLEPVLLEPKGAVIEGIRSNLLLRIGSDWVTPRLDQFGVRGVMLRWLAGQVEISEDTLYPSDLARADELAICNSVRGVIPARLLASTPQVLQMDPQIQSPVRPGRATSVLQALISEELW
ncbi:aminotransferase class IV [Microbulbifer agarilyticus]|uniref:aminotransferase class IV n=1 Tax=Microbulbifer agarilyticus TaxID=260552 RepID=UPI001C95DA26|nr:aminotransferase class IV [Microbulbifer agarilyticus]MBY6189419.1 aminotransferase class IV [Microbulbifer agarilyticus]